MISRFVLGASALGGSVRASPVLRVFCSVVVTGVALALVLVTVDGSELRRVFAAADYRYWVPAVVVYFFGLWMRSERWREVLRGIGLSREPSSVYSSMLLGYAANNILPARLGEAVRAWSFCRRNSGCHGGSVFATIVVERIFDCFFLSVSGALVTGALLALGHVVEGWRAAVVVLLCLFVSGAAAAALVFSLLLKVSAGRGGWRRLWRLLSPCPGRSRMFFFRWILRAGTGIDGMRSLRRRRRVLLWTAGVWGTEVVVYLLVALGFGWENFAGGAVALLLSMVLVTVAANLGTLVPLTLGGLGFVEAAASRSLVLLGVAPALALAFSLTVHLLVAWVPVNCVAMVVVIWWGLCRCRGPVGVGRWTIRLTSRTLRRCRSVRTAFRSGPFGRLPGLLRVGRGGRCGSRRATRRRPSGRIQG